MLERMNVGRGDTLYAIEAPDGSYRLTPYDPDFAASMEKADDIHAALPRYVAYLGSVSAAAPIWLELPLILAIHDRLLVLHGGAEGLQGQGLLLSALARPKHLAAYDGNIDVIDMAAAYTFGLVDNHPFVTGNKRTGFVAGILFLEINGHVFSAPQDAAATAVIDLAAGVIDEAIHVEFLRKHASSQ